MITLRAMTEEEFQAFFDYSIGEYAKEKVMSGNWAESEALERSRKEFDELLPKGAQSEGNTLLTLVNESGESVGYLWYAVNPRRAGRVFIYDFEVYSSFRRRGYASQALAALEELLRPQGFKHIDLHVFGHNTPARELYKKTGYSETNINMSKDI